MLPIVTQRVQCGMGEAGDFSVTLLGYGYQHIQNEEAVQTHAASLMKHIVMYLTAAQ